MRERYPKRLSVLLESSRQRLSGLLEVSDIEAGLQTVGWLRPGIDGESAAKAAAARQVEVIPSVGTIVAARHKKDYSWDSQRLVPVKSGEVSGNLR